MNLIDQRKKELETINNKLKEITKRKKFILNYIFVTEYRAKKRLEKKENVIKV